MRRLCVRWQGRRITIDCQIDITCGVFRICINPRLFDFCKTLDNSSDLSLHSLHNKDRNKTIPERNEMEHTIEFSPYHSNVKYDNRMFGVWKSSNDKKKICYSLKRHFRYLNMNNDWQEQDFSFLISSMWLSHLLWCLESLWKWGARMSFWQEQSIWHVCYQNMPYRRQSNSRSFTIGEFLVQQNIFWIEEPQS